MKVAAIGRTEILYDSIIALIEAGHQVPLIITAKEAPEYKRSSNDFKLLAESVGAQFFMTGNISSCIDQISNIDEIDIAISINYPTVIKNNLIDSFRLGVLNAHGGDLPRYRGNACQAWAILNGEKEIGLCIHKMVAGELDSGDIISRDYYPIDINTSITEVWNWMSKLIPSLFLESINKLKLNDQYYLEKQSTNSLDILRCYPRLPEDGRINWASSNQDVLRLINASNKPYSGAFCFLNEGLIRVWKAELVDDNERYVAVPGQVTKIGSGYIEVATGRGKVRLLIIEMEARTDRASELINSIRTRFK